jgi:hypothetical protein
MVCSIVKLNNPIPPNALCIVHHSLFTFRFTPRNNRSQKFCFFNTSVAVDRGVASTARPYLTPAHNLKRYAIQPSFAGRWPFFILLIHFSTRSVTLCCTCASLLPSMLDQIPSAFSAMETFPCDILAVSRLGKEISTSRLGCTAYVHLPPKQQKSASVHLHLSGFKAPPVAFSPSAQISVIDVDFP